VHVFSLPVPAGRWAPRPPSPLSVRSSVRSPSGWPFTPSENSLLMRLCSTPPIVCLNRASGSPRGGRTSKYAWTLWKTV